MFFSKKIKNSPCSQKAAWTAWTRRKCSRRCLRKPTGTTSWRATWPPAKVRNAVSPAPTNLPSVVDTRIFLLCQVGANDSQKHNFPTLTLHITSVWLVRDRFPSQRWGNGLSSTLGRGRMIYSEQASSVFLHQHQICRGEISHWIMAMWITPPPFFFLMGGWGWEGCNNKALPYGGTGEK